MAEQLRRLLGQTDEEEQAEPGLFDEVRVLYLQDTYVQDKCIWANECVTNKLFKCGSLDPVCLVVWIERSDWRPLEYAFLWVSSYQHWWEVFSRKPVSSSLCQIMPHANQSTISLTMLHFTKFAILQSTGNVISLCSTAFLVGPWQQLKSKRMLWVAVKCSSWVVFKQILLIPQCQTCSMRLGTWQQ